MTSILKSALSCLWKRFQGKDVEKNDHDRRQIMTIMMMMAAALPHSDSQFKYQFQTFSDYSLTNSVHRNSVQDVRAGVRNSVRGGRKCHSGCLCLCELYWSSRSHRWKRLLRKWTRKRRGNCNESLSFPSSTTITW